MAGRQTEIDSFRIFLKEPAAWLQFWRGIPGTGKSRLMLEFARVATLDGWRVFFVNGSTVHDLAAALLKIESTEPVLLIWDDYKGESSDALRTFLDPPEIRAPNVKRVITAWPTINVLGEKARNPLFVTIDLKAIVPETELIVFTRSLLPGLTEGDARHVTRLAECHPEAVLQAVLQILGGTKVNELPPDLLASAYDKVVSSLTAFGKELRAMALIGRLDLSNDIERDAFAGTGALLDSVARLQESGAVFQEGNIVVLGPDGFSAHVVLRSMTPSVISGGGTAHGLAQFARALLPVFMGRIWAICVLAAGQDEKIRSELLSAIVVNGIQDGQAAVRIAGQLLAATRAEPIASWTVKLASGIGRIREEYNTAEIAEVEAWVRTRHVETCATVPSIGPQSQFPRP